MQTRKLHRLFNIDTSLIVAIRKGRSGYSRIAYQQLSSVARVMWASSLARSLGAGANRFPGERELGPTDTLRAIYRLQSAHFQRHTSHLVPPTRDSPSTHSQVLAMESSPLPVATSLDEIYTDAALAHEGQRWNSVFDAFQKEYGTPAQKVARAPGRVNIIGPFRSPPPSPFRPAVSTVRTN